MTTEEKIANSITRIFKAVFPNTTNYYDTLFGGTAMLSISGSFTLVAVDENKKKVSIQ